LFLIGNIGWSMSAACSRSPGPGFLLLYWLAVQWAFAWWVLVDCRRRGIATSVDHGWFVSLAWPVAIPYHLFRTRGVRGCVVIAGMLGMFAASWGVALVLFFLLAP